ncbi:TMEM175 family protein [Streptomyces sp. RS2]|uniref:TMEM175 family protein n=1 Tax=Streptomyces sp. RS2 TaxID=1451205 RepID=UPI0021F8C81B|nr:TMEM175 family protein [Streptomyces sp. RS2]MCW1100162.1 TMEM175 family protein [Streptomyces sp. RS2]
MPTFPFTSNLLHGTVAVRPERVSLFGDAIFAIAITLLSLEITIPEELPDSRVAQALRDALPAIGAYLLSFAVIGVLWLTQHAFFRLITTLDRCLLYLYFGLLAVVAALPFPTRLISEYGGTSTATLFYATSIALAILLICTMYGRVLARPRLASSEGSPSVLKGALLRSSAMAIVFVSSVPVAFASPIAAKYWWLLAAPARLLFRQRPSEDENTMTEHPSA